MLQKQLKLYNEEIIDLLADDANDYKVLGILIPCCTL